MTDKNQDAFAKARERYEQAVSYWGEWRKAAREDREFFAGDQWLPADRNNREIQCRPILTINRLPVFARQIIGDARQNKPSIKIYPAEDGDAEIAEIYEGLIRNIEYVSSAPDAYDTAFESAVICGIGAWRVCTDYVSDDAFEQHILIERIREPLSITIDPNSERADFSDAEWLFYEYDLSKEEFKHKWPDADLSDFATSDAMPGWLDRDSVRVAEYWFKERAKKTIYLLGDGTVTDKMIPGLQVIRQRDVESVKVKRATMAGWTFLDEPQDWPGTMFPFAIVTGEEYRIKNKTDYRGIVRNAIDAQRMYNYWRTMETENIALAPKTPFLVADDQIEGLEQEWNNLNTVPMPYVRYNANSQAPIPHQIQPPQIPTAYANASAVCVDEIKSTTGLFNASLGEGGTESSGRAILARQREGDTATFLWVDNLNRAIRYTGKILVELIPKIYDSERIIRVLGPDASNEQVAINRVVGDGMGGTTIINDLSFGRYDVIVESGPSFATKRIEALNNMVEIARMNPAIMQVAGDLMVKAMDWEGAEEIAERLKLMLPPQILAAEKHGEDGEDGPQIPPEIQAQIQQGMHLIEQQKARIDELEDELEDKDEDRRLKQYEIDVKAEIEAAKIVAANPDASMIAAQAAQILAQQFMNQAASMQDVTESGEDEQESPEQPEQMEMPVDEPVEMPEMQPVTEYIPDLPEITGNEPEEFPQ